MIRLDDEEGVLKDRLREMQKSIAEYLNIQFNSRIGEYALESFIKNTRNVENQVTYIDMLKVETYCIGEYYHDGCRVIHRESDNKRTVAQIEFGKTKAYLCSIVYKIKRNDWTRLWKENRNLHFWLECSKAALCNIEVHFENESYTLATAFEIRLYICSLYFNRVYPHDYCGDDTKNSNRRKNNHDDLLGHCFRFHNKSSL